MHTLVGRHHRLRPCTVWISSGMIQQDSNWAQCLLIDITKPTKVTSEFVFIPYSSDSGCFEFSWMFTKAIAVSCIHSLNHFPVSTTLRNKPTCPWSYGPNTNQKWHFHSFAKFCLHLSPSQLLLGTEKSLNFPKRSTSHIFLISQGTVTLSVHQTWLEFHQQQTFLCIPEA